MTREQYLITTLANKDKKYTPESAHEVQDMLDELKAILTSYRCCETCRFMSSEYIGQVKYVKCSYGVFSIKDNQNINLCALRCDIWRKK